MSDTKEKKWKLDYANKVILGKCYKWQYDQLSIKFAGGNLEFSKARSGDWYAFYVPSVAVDGDKPESKAVLTDAPEW